MNLHVCICRVFVCLCVRSGASFLFLFLLLKYNQPRDCGSSRCTTVVQYFYTPQNDHHSLPFFFSLSFEKQTFKIFMKSNLPVYSKFFFFYILLFNPT